MYKTNQSILTYFLWLLLAAFVIFIAFLHLYLCMPGVDSGLYMYGSFLINKGLLPYEHLWNNKPPLIYLIGTAGFLLKSNPFFAVRIFEVIVFFIDLLLINSIARRLALRRPVIYMLSFCIIFLSCWDLGFLTETFTIPLTLITLYLFIRKIIFFEPIAVLLLVLCFLLKQNAIAVPACIILVDILTTYRGVKKSKKIGGYLFSVAFFFGAVFLIIKNLGIWPEFVDQVFVYNSKYVPQSSLRSVLISHLRRNSFLSIRGVSAILIFNLCLILSLWKYWKHFKGKIDFHLKDQFLALAIVVYFVSYISTYFSGKTYAHYFMLLIIPASFLFGNYIIETSFAKIAITILALLAITSNTKEIFQYKDFSRSRNEVAYFIKTHSTQNDYILVAGFGNQFLHVLSDRLSPTKFIMPLLEPNGYVNEYRTIITQDLKQKPPLFIILNKKNYRSLNSRDFYTKTITNELNMYHPAFENVQFLVYQRSVLGQLLHKPRLTLCFVR